MWRFSFCVRGVTRYNIIEGEDGLMRGRKGNVPWGQAAYRKRVADRDGGLFGGVKLERSRERSGVAGCGQLGCACRMTTRGAERQAVEAGRGEMVVRRTSARGAPDEGGARRCRRAVGRSAAALEEQDSL